MQTQTYYEATAPRLTFAPLAGMTCDVEVAVLGGGFAGLATARGLQERGITSVAVLEAQTIGHGASGRNRISIQEREPARIAQLLQADLLKVYPQLARVRVAHAWGGLMSYARHKMPQIGQLAPGLWFAQAFGGHGVAPTTVAGEWLAEAISGRANLPAALQRYGLTPVFGQAGLLAAQASYSWAELRDALKERLT